MGAKTIAELREELQGPRRPFDTWYGKRVMRRMSIYLTIFFSKTPASPVFVTGLSILCGLVGAWRLRQADWAAGILWVNGWYLLDHVDGELARLKKMSSLTGLFFDTLANAIVQPLAFYAIGAALAGTSGEDRWRFLGAAAAYGSLMMLVVPFCIAETLSTRPGAARSAAARENKGSLSRRLFARLHLLITFPVVLPVFTVLILTLFWVSEEWLESALEVLIAAYTAAVHLVWIAVVTHAVVTKKLDKDRAPGIS